MNQLVKVGIVFALLILGIAAALAFRKTPEDDGDDSSAAQQQDGKQSISQGQEVAVTTQPATTDPAPANAGGVVAHKPVGPTGAERTAPSPSTLQVPPPAMSAAFPRSRDASLAPLPRVDQPAPAPAAAMVDLLDNESAAVRIRRHTIRDGDTLADLAGRFLGDLRRADEIFAANREVLDHPDILPIGTTLSIPIAPPPPNIAPSSNSTGISPADLNEPSEITAAGPLVPVAPPQ